MSSLRALAAAQTVPVAGDVEHNLARHVELVRLGATEGARVVVFPELSLTGYELPLGPALAFEERDARLDPLVAVSRETGAVLIVGAPVRIASVLHIGALIVAPSGDVDVYTKRHLGAFPPSANPDGPVPPPEASVFEAGARDPLVSVDGNTGAVAICADMGRAAHAERAAGRAADLYLASTFVIPSDLEGDVARLQGYAQRHAMAVVFSNFGGPSGGLASAGHSSIWSDTGELLVRLDTAGEGIAIALEGPTAWRAKALMLDPRC